MTDKDTTPLQRDVQRINQAVSEALAETGLETAEVRSSVKSFENIGYVTVTISGGGE